jgi:hypothetical protein
LFTFFSEPNKIVNQPKMQFEWTALHFRSEELSGLAGIGTSP